jgi:hypothetical protein
MIINDEYYNSLKICADHYRSMLDDMMPKPHQSHDLRALGKFIDEYSKGVEDKLPLCKLNRWLGYIQGVLIIHGFCTVESERDFTRPLFRPLDFEE